MEKTDFTEAFIEENNPCPEIYPRFKIARNSLVNAIYGSPTSEVDRDFRSKYWPEGIIDHRGSIEGVLDGIKLSVKVTGTTMPEKQYNRFDEDGNSVKKVRKEESHISIYGNFVCRDGKEGFMEIVAQDGVVIFEGYWLEDHQRNLVLEQVADVNGNVFSLEDIENMVENRLYIVMTEKEWEYLKDLGIPKEQIFHNSLTTEEWFEERQRNRKFLIYRLENREDLDIIGISGGQIFNNDLEFREWIEYKQKEREYKIPGLMGKIPMRKKKILTRNN